MSAKGGEADKIKILGKGEKGKEVSASEVFNRSKSCPPSDIVYKLRKGA